MDTCPWFGAGLARWFGVRNLVREAIVSLCGEIRTFLKSVDTEISPFSLNYKGALVYGIGGSSKCDW